MVSHTCIMLDAVSLINLYASKHIEEILQAMPCQIVITEYVKSNEALWVYTDPNNKVKTNTTPIVLDPLIKVGLLKVVNYGNAVEAQDFVYFSQFIDDGEAVTGAIAINRGWSIASEDRGALRCFRREAPQLKLVSTFDLIQWWIDKVQPDDNLIVEILRNIWQIGGHKPHPSHSLFGKCTGF